MAGNIVRRNRRRINHQAAAGEGESYRAAGRRKWAKEISDRDVAMAEERNQAWRCCRGNRAISGAVFAAALPRAIVAGMPRSPGRALPPYTLWRYLCRPSIRTSPLSLRTCLPPLTLCCCLT